MRTRVLIIDCGMGMDHLSALMDGDSFRGICPLVVVEEPKSTQEIFNELAERFKVPNLKRPAPKFVEYPGHTTRPNCPKKIKAKV